MADTKLTALTETSVPDVSDPVYSVDVSDTTDDPAGSSRKLTLARLLGLLHHVCQGRLTLESGVPVSTSDQTGKTTVYFTPCNGSLVSVYDGTRWKLYSFTEVSLALGTLTSGANYDVFLYDSSGTLTLKFGPAWSSDTARGTGAGTTELTTQDGVYVNAVSIASGPGAKAGRYLGTIRTTSTTTTEDSAGGASQAGGKRFVWSMYNRACRPLSVIDTTDNWSYGTATWRSADNAAGNKVEYVAGLSLDVVSARVHSNILIHDNSTAAARVGVGIDSTSTPSGFNNEGFSGNSGNLYVGLFASYDGYPGIGYHALNWIEKGAGGTTSIFLGDDGNSDVRAGLSALVWG